MRSTTSRARVVRLLGASLYFGAVVLILLQAGDWGQTLLALVSVTAGLLSGRLWSLALAASIIPAAAVLWFVPSDDYHGDSVSGPLDAAIFGGLFVLPLAAAIAVGVGLRRLVNRRRNRRESPRKNREHAESPAGRTGAV